MAPTDLLLQEKKNGSEKSLCLRVGSEWRIITVGYRYKFTHTHTMSSALTQEVQKELESFVAKQVQQIPELAEDANDVAEYLVLLVNYGRTPEQAYTELHSIFSSEALTGVVQSAYKALEDYQNTQQQQQQQQQQAAPVAVPTAPATSTPTTQQTQQQAEGPQQQDTDSIVTDGNADGNSLKNIPSRPAAYARNNGINKNGRGGRPTAPKSFALRNPELLQKALNASGTELRIKKKGRCQEFPHCPNRMCEYAHPTKPCFNFLNGNCPNPKGTCNFLHPSEDQELIAELEKTNKEYHEKKAQKQIQYAQAATGITLCKFGNLCTNQQCPFGHPTPANEDAKVITFEWCAANLKCENATCTKAHSSHSKIKEVTRPTPASKPTVEKVLEACKFGANCTNRHCKYRHASSKTMCRDGANCTRIDCFFSHPINEECRFGEGCKNPNCLFQHPNGKAPITAQPKSLSWTKTNERQFAVPDDQVMEQAPQQTG